MIQVAAENYSQENFLGLGNKKKQAERKAVRQEKREVKREARQKTNGILGKIGNRLGVGKQATAIRKDFKTAKREIKNTGSFTRGSVSGGTIRKNPSSSVKFGGSKNGKPIANNNLRNALGLPSVPVQKLPTPVRGTTPEQRGTLPQKPEYLQEQVYSSGTQAMPQEQAKEQPYSSGTQAMPQEQAQGQEGEQVEEKNPDGTPKEKPFNWKIWGGVGGGVVLLIMIGVIIYLTTKK